MRPKARPVRLGGPQVRAPGVVGAIANACERIAPSPWQRGERIRSISGPAPSFERSGSGSVVAISGILGVGLDGDDGHKRITRTEQMVLVGGSAETHERMQETAIWFAEGLEKRGKVLTEVSVKEAADLLRAAHDKVG